MRRCWSKYKVFAAFATAALALAGCDRGKQAAAMMSSRPIVAPGAGVVEGVVNFSGPPPAAVIIGGECCSGSARMMDESTVVNGNGTLGNVEVYVKDGPNVATATDHAPAVLDQKDCRYRPHVIAVRTGEPLEVISHDPTLHNVDVMAWVNGAINFSETSVGASRQLTFAEPEMIHVKCDVHPWMSAYICVFDHPFFAVTGADGRFRIPRLPSGSYTLVAWHEKYGKLERSFSVDGTNAAEVDFEYKP